ncbi:hypothetical protein ACFQX4_17745 [Roseomonas sp. GCM10028921]
MLRRIDAPTARELLAEGIHPRLLKAEAPLLAEIEEGFVPPVGPGAPEALVLHLVAHTEARSARLSTIRKAFAEFNIRLARATGETERRGHIADFARILGASDRQLRGDAKAFNRWFGSDAMIDRTRKRIGEEERRLGFTLDRLGPVASRALAASEDVRATWRRLGVELLLARMLTYGGDGRVRTAGMRCLATALSGAPLDLQESLLSEATLRRVQRAALEPGLDVWTAAQALEILSGASPELFDRALELRLAPAMPPPPDDLFFRRRAVALLCDAVGKRPGISHLLTPVLQDSSPAVRQAMALHLHRLPKELAAEHFPGLACGDAAAEVRAATLAAVEHLLPLTGPEPLAAVFIKVLREETSPFVVRVALHFADCALAWLRAHQPEAARGWADALMPEMGRLHLEAKSLPIRRWAAQAYERMWCQTDAEARALLELLSAAVGRLDEGKTRRLPKPATSADPVLLGRVLAVMAQADFGYEVAGRRIRRGDRFRFRLWRALHEWRHPSPDKRQAFPHTIGRVYTGTLSAPSGIMAELAQTKVPGEPYFIGEEVGWRPWLPLPDHALSAIDTGATVMLHTAEGVTSMEPPSSFLRRLSARLRLSHRFSAIADLRNWSEARSQPPTAYLRALTELGFTFRHEPHRGAAVDPAVARFFPALIPVPLMIDGSLWQRIGTYFVSVYENSIPHLVIFMIAAAAWFFGRHILVNFQMRRARNAIPLVLGGWGTRGKSGTERLKAALVSGLGYPLISKTTGCEAMFLVGEPFGQVREMFLFRPYDKATIWEQMNIVRLSVKLRADVFLWECMGLTPGYVQVLQRHWMRDDISTITNTYPDHEDLQGPAGRNIPEVMTNFIPRLGTVLTTEEQMRPILADAARRLKTRLVPIGWLEAGLIPSDCLKRFPYEEHPFNIALVLGLAEEIGVDRDLALKEMADRVVPDLGVLKAFPVAPVRSRRLEFVNGMSANERFGAMSNWARMGFDTQDPYCEPGVWLTTVVNNRADRVPRSRVFAAMIANDLSADRHILIGSNLEGLQGYIEEAWAHRATGMTLWPETGNAREADPQETLNSTARWLRVARSADEARAYLRAMLKGQPVQMDIAALLEVPLEGLEAALSAAGVAGAADIVVHYGQALKAAQDYEALAKKIRSGSAGRKELDAAFVEQATAWFRAKIAVVEDFYASGDQVVERIAAETPPGILNRIMGIQNIKGTGLDFVYRWQAWDTVHTACAMATSADPAQAQEGLRTLAAYQEFGVLSEETVRETLDRLRTSQPALGAAFLDQVELARSNFGRQMAELRAGMGVTRAAGGLSRILDTVEALFDAGDAVRRRRKAERIYRDLAAERISLDRAALELKKLNSRQKGGWLAEEVQLAGGRLNTLLQMLPGRRHRQGAAA